MLKTVDGIDDGDVDVDGVWQTIGYWATKRMIQNDRDDDDENGSECGYEVAAVDSGDDGDGY